MVRGEQKTYDLHDNTIYAYQVRISILYFYTISRNSRTKISLRDVWYELYTHDDDR